MARKVKAKRQTALSKAKSEIYKLNNDLANARYSVTQFTRNQEQYERSLKAREADITLLRRDVSIAQEETNKYRARVARLENVTKSLKEAGQKTLLAFDTLA